MTSQRNLKKFNEIYDSTYSDILKYIVIKCHNINDVNDILQETYLEFWKLLNKKDIEDKNIKSYLIGIAINKIKKYYSFIYKLNEISIFSKNDKDIELQETFESSTNIEDSIIKKEEFLEVWKYIKSKKNQNIPKIFYLYYKLDLTIKEISEHLGKSESYIKNSLYRTLKELHRDSERESR